MILYRANLSGVLSSLIGSLRILWTPFFDNKSLLAKIPFKYVLIFQLFSNASRLSIVHDNMKRRASTTKRCWENQDCSRVGSHLAGQVGWVE